MARQLQVDNWAEGAARIAREMAFEMQWPIHSLAMATKAGAETSVAALEGLDMSLQVLIEDNRKQLVKLTEIGAALDQIVGLLANPRGTAGAELRRTGAIALVNGWYDDAERDLLASVEISRYDPTVHYMLGNLFAITARPREASESFASSARYASAVIDHRLLAPGLAASAALLGFRHAKIAGGDDARSILFSTRDALTHGPRNVPCPAIEFELGLVTDELEHLCTALTHDPLLVVEAQRRGRNVDVAAGRALPVWRERLQTLITAYHSTSEMRRWLGLKDFSVAVSPAHSPSEELVSTAAGVGEYRQGFIRMTSVGTARLLRVGPPSYEPLVNQSDNSPAIQKRGLGFLLTLVGIVCAFAWIWMPPSGAGLLVVGVGIALIYYGSKFRRSAKAELRSAQVESGRAEALHDSWEQQNAEYLSAVQRNQAISYMVETIQKAINETTAGPVLVPVFGTDLGNHKAIGLAQ